MLFFDETLIQDSQRLSKLAMGISTLVFVLISIDLFGDYQEGVPLLHLSIEILIFALSMSGIIYFGKIYSRLMQSAIKSLQKNLAEANQQAEHWRKANRELIAGLAAQIQKQFEQWQLTRAEAEVGVLLLKGLSLHEIAQVRQTSERTIRDQARAVYRKSGLVGRSELSAFFLEDLLLPFQ